MDSRIKLAQQLIESEPLQLPPADVRLVNLADSLKFFGIDPKNPRIKQGLEDLALSILEGGQTASKGENKEVWISVVKRAKDLGFYVQLVDHNQILLENWVAKSRLPSREEKRLGKGNQQKVAFYLRTPELDSEIVSFFDRLD